MAGQAALILQNQRPACLHPWRQWACLLRPARHLHAPSLGIKPQAIGDATEFSFQRMRKK
jgi:hypothetical protein